MDKTEVIGYSVSGINTLLTTIQMEQTFRIIQLVIAILVGVVTLIYTTYKTIKLAKADGKIDDQEKKQILDNTIDGVKDIIESVDNFKKGDKKDGSNHKN